MDIDIGITILRSTAVVVPPPAVRRFGLDWLGPPKKKGEKTHGSCMDRLKTPKTVVKKKFQVALKKKVAAFPALLLVVPIGSAWPL